MLDKIEKLSKVLNESYSEKSLCAALADFFAQNFGIDGFSIEMAGKNSNLKNAAKLNHPYLHQLLEHEHPNQNQLYKHKKVIANLCFAKVNDELDKFLQLTSSFISLKIQNILISEKMQKNINFHDTMKNIAKIIETQYELNYIIPIIGEIIDKFFENYLIYIFLVNENTGENYLAWPMACKDDKMRVR